MADKPLECLNPMKPWKITKNVVVISFASMINFTAFVGAVNLQSSVNAEDGLGTASLAALYITGLFANMFVSVGLIRWLGTKWTITLAYLAYMPYIAAQMHPTFYTMIPAALLLGLCCGPLWSAKLTYISKCAEIQSRISNTSVEELMTRYLGLFYMIFQINQVFGNLISSLVLSSSDNAAAVTSLNETMIPIMCGAEFLPSVDAGEALPPQPANKIRLLSGIYLACIAGAALLAAVGVDSMNRYNYNFGEPRNQPNSMQLLSLTLKVMIEPSQLLMIIITIFNGMQQAFIGAEFSASFVSCAVGTGYIGFVFTAYGLSNVFGSLLLRYSAKVIHRFYLICTAVCIHAMLFCTLLMWRPHAGEVYILFILVIMWGFCESIWLVQIHAIYALLFPGRQEAAFSNTQIWHSIGYIISYVVSPYLITRYKIYLLLASLLIGALSYSIVEHQHKRLKKNEDRDKDSHVFTRISSN